MGTIRQLKIKGHDFVFSDEDILSEWESFQSKLYTSQGTNSADSEASTVFFSEKIPQ